MQFIILFHEPADIFASRTESEQAAAYWGAWSAYIEAINAAGIVVHGNGLEPPVTASRVQMRGGERLVQDGPAPGTKEQLGGYFVVEVPDRQTALDWAARSPAAEVGTCEVRPILVMS